MATGTSCDTMITGRSALMLLVLKQDITVGARRHSTQGRPQCGSQDNVAVGHAGARGGGAKCEGYIDDLDVFHPT